MEDRWLTVIFEGQEIHSTCHWGHSADLWGWEGQEEATTAELFAHVRHILRCHTGARVVGVLAPEFEFWLLTNA